MSWFGPCPEYGYPDYCPPYEVQEAPFKNPESLSKAQKRLVRLAQEKVVDQIICGDDERRLAGWQIMHVTIKNHAHQPGRYELVGRPRRDSARARAPRRAASRASPPPAPLLLLPRRAVRAATRTARRCRARSGTRSSTRTGSS
jgi:hypothetical protein